MHLAAALALFGGASAVSVDGSFAVAMLSSIMDRNQGVTPSGASSNTLEGGILSLALLRAIEVHPEQSSVYNAYIDRVLDSITPNLLDATADSMMPLDRFSVDVIIATRGPQSTSQSAAQTALAESYLLQKRSDDGSPWYYVYPNVTALDGAISIYPWRVGDDGPTAVADVQTQIDNIKEHCLDSSGLYYHGYDPTHNFVWADNPLGHSPTFWGRATGWWALGLVQAYEANGCGGSVSDPVLALCDNIRDTTVALANTLVDFADPDTGVWWQVLDQGGRQGNFRESSCTALFITVLLKSIRLGMVPDAQVDRLRAAAVRAYEYTTEHFVTDTGDGTIGFNSTVVVCSLNSTATYEFYTSRGFAENSLLGEAGFTLASLEMEVS